MPANDPKSVLFNLLLIRILEILNTYIESGMHIEWLDHATCVLLEKMAHKFRLG